MDRGAQTYRRYLDGDESAFDTLVACYFDGLVFFVDRFVRDTAAAEDIAIDVFSDLVVNPRRYHFGVSLKTYLFMLGRSRALNYIKRRGLVKTVPLTEAETLADRQSLEERCIADARRRQVSDALARLDPPLRIAVHLVYFEGLSCEEAGKVMKKSRKQVYNLLYRAKNALREILNQEVLWE